MALRIDFGAGKNLDEHRQAKKIMNVQGALYAC